MKYLILFLSVIVPSLAADVYFGKEVTLKGTPVAHEDLLTETEGKPVIIHWGSFKCPRCTSQHKDFIKLAKSGKRKGYVVLAAHSEQMEEEALVKAIKKSKIKVPFYGSGALSGTDKMEKSGIPMYFLFGADGKYIKTFSDAKKARKAADKLMRK